MSEAAELYKSIRPEYEHDPDIFCPDPPRTRRVKAAIEQLPDEDKAIVTLYAELGSYRKLGAMLGVGRDTAWKEIRRIRAEILKIMERI